MECYSSFDAVSVTTYPDATQRIDTLTVTDSDSEPGVIGLRLKIVQKAEFGGTEVITDTGTDMTLAQARNLAQNLLMLVERADMKGTRTRDPGE